VDQRGQGIEEEHAFQAMAVQHVHLPAYAMRLPLRFGPDRTADIVIQVDAALLERGGQFRIDGDEQRGHGRSGRGEAIGQQ